MLVRFTKTRHSLTLAEFFSYCGIEVRANWAPWEDAGPGVRSYVIEMVSEPFYTGNGRSPADAAKLLTQSLYGRDVWAPKMGRLVKTPWLQDHGFEFEVEEQAL